jgi:uncharacterized protein YbjT (DUF2867 family)
MNILVVGGAGRTGGRIVEQALGHGHSVRVLVHNNDPKVTHQRLELVHGDVLDEDAVSAAVSGMDAVAFAPSSGGGRTVTVYSAGIANVLYAMALREVDRIVAISAAGVFARTDSRLPLSFRAKIATTLRPVYDDMERMEQRIAASGVGWTIVRPVGLTNDPATGDYRVSTDGSLLPKAARIARADVAALALKSLETGAFEGKTLVIAQ